MHWWSSGFSSSSPPPSSSKAHSEDGFIESGGCSRYSLKSAFTFASNRRRSRSDSRRITRPTKLHYLGDEDWRSQCSYENSPARCSSGGLPLPQPLPLPEFQLLLRQDTNSISQAPSVPLPSPHNDGGSSIESRLLGQDAQKRTEHSRTRLSRKTPQKLHVAERVPDFRIINTPVSAPTSPYASPALSPHRSGDVPSPRFITPPSVFHVWSAPELPPSDALHYPRFSYQAFPEKNAFSVDSSPLHSPRISPQRTKSPSGPTSPLHHLLPNECSIARRESGAQGNVYPLPLPPLATPSQPVAISPVTPKAELAPIKGQWQKGKLIGRGTFGSVYVASNRETGALCAMKEVELLPDDSKSAECIRQLEQEIKVLSQLKHPNIVQYYGSEILGDRFYIYLEYVHPGSINKFIHDHCGAITESIVRNFTRHILCGLAYLHSKKTIHRDIKGANLLVDAYGVVKLADFGMAKHLNGQAANLSLKGSPYWMAPELMQSVLQRDSSSELALAIDIWSLGCTVIEMFTGKPPWSDFEAAAAMFKVLKDTPPIPETLSPEGKDFLRLCFHRNPAERPSASMLLEHRFVRISNQQDVPSFVRPVNWTRLTEKLHSHREQLSYKLDSGPVSL